MKTKLEAFRALLETEQTARLKSDGLGCEANIQNARCTVKLGAKYARVDTGTSGKYMVTMDKGEIFGIKAYGVIHRRHRFGTLDTISAWDWGGYRAVRHADDMRPVYALADEVANVG